jgi:transglutaminase-like putative cysteine protease
VTLAFGREKRLLLGALAALAPVPLPFNEMLGWPFLLAYLAGTAWFFARARADRGGWLPAWAMNLLGLAYLPLFFFDLTMFSGGRLVGPVLHLGMFAVLIKLFSLRRERDKWQALMGIFFLFLAAMATSVHPSVTLYLAAFLAGAVLLLTRFALLHLLAGFGHHDAALARVPLKGFLAACVVFSLVLAVPLFALLPRVTSPYLAGGLGGGGPQVQVTGYSEEVTLDSIGRIRESREIALRVRYADGDRPADAGQRFKAATFDSYDGRAWRRSPALRSLVAPGGLRVELAPGEVERWATVFLQPVTGRSVPLPTTTRILEIGRRSLELGTGGSVYLSFPLSTALDYRVGLGRGAASAAAEPDPADPAPPTLDATGVTPEMAALAAGAMGEGGAGERARKLEAFLAREYGYTLDFVGRGGDRPLEDFLFRYKSGHCEYFATAMVLLLRSQGIHARLATGFLGADYNPLEGLWVVRQANAHAWVEAWVPGRGWVEFDPTPPAGRPAGGGGSAWDLAVQAWETLVFRWDRYVLTYGFDEQVGLFASLRRLWSQLFERRGGEEAAGTAAPAEAAPASPAGLPAAGGGGVPAALAAAAVLLAVVLAAWWFHRRGPLTATAAYRRLRRDLARAGVAVPASLPPLALGRRAAAARPAAAEPAGRVIAFYLRESFNGEALGDEERGELEAALRRAGAVLRKAG